MPYKNLIVNKNSHEIFLFKEKCQAVQQSRQIRDPSQNQHALTLMQGMGDMKLLGGLHWQNNTCHFA
jgi:hypothetical protein